jgi:sterol desaturase/sphingolipid hydroxylase (fatty acid hydroxylase superfamily)
METYGKILLVAMPIFLVLVLLEKWYGWYKGQDTVRNMDMISSLASGVTNVTKDVLGLSITILSYEWLVNHIAIYSIKATWLTYVVAFLVLDFSSYWTHRWAHKINVLWNRHIVHHSSEEFNLACALRQSISVFINIFTFLLVPAALLGVPRTSHCRDCAFAFVRTVLVSYPPHREDGIPGEDHRYPITPPRSSCDQSGVPR